jgi:cyclic pyranopterin phosphate synthase
VYCRPTGEGVYNSKTAYNNISNIIRIAELYKKYGGTDVKLTGGEPLLWDDIPECVHLLKHEIQISNVELITRSPRIMVHFDALKKAGLDTLNFSLDTVNAGKYRKINGVDDFEEYIYAIKYCTQKGIRLKLNSVIMKDVNDSDIDSLISFCEGLEIHQLKLLDVIVDLHNSESNNKNELQSRWGKELASLYVPLSEISDKIRCKAVKTDTVFQGGLGHPMGMYVLQSGLEVVVKDSKNGAWYNDSCKDCDYFPCHDALMAIRLTVDNTLQFCLLNEKSSNLTGLNDVQLENEFASALQFYEEAVFYDTIGGKESK